jgi:glycerol kinase
MSKTIRAFVGIDAGTTGCTVMVFDEHGKSIGQGYEEYPCIAPNPGWNEQDLEAVWKGICGASRKAVAMADLPKEAYRSVPLQRSTLIKSRLAIHGCGIAGALLSINRSLHNRFHLMSIKPIPACS